MRTTFKNLQKKDIFFILICAVLVVTQVWLELKMPDYTQKLTELVSSGNADMDAVLQNGGKMLLCAVLSMGAAIICGFFASHVAANFARTLRIKLFDRITNFGDSEINRFSTPSLITRTTNDVVQLQMLIAIGLQVMIKAPVMAVWAIGKISATNVQWTEATLATVMIMVALIGILVGLCYPRFKKIQKLTDDLNNATRENISGVRVVRAFNADEYQHNKFEKINNNVMRNNMFTSRLMGLMMPVLQLCMSGLTLAIYWIGAYVINDAPLMDKATQMGNMTAFTQYALQVVMSFMMLIMIFVILPRTMVSARRIAEVLNTKSSISYRDKAVSAEKTGELEFRNVSFKYGDADNDCINDISFKINKGETFAIIGATGSGKSTIVNLIPRYYDVTGGEILLDGVDIREYPEEQLQKKISIAPQKAVMFMGDIKSNVIYGSEENADDERVKRALKIANADFVENLTDGINERVAQGGTNYSGGQKQRLSIARAIYKDSEIIIFDDTFSALDYKTDMLVRKAIKKNLKGTTVIIVAQRIGTIKNADKILVLDEGRIVGMGTHKELLENCAIYKEIALSQLSKEEL
ncbi:MAG: ABC transporter ATP-binding protein [Candidatus Alectryocaccobium sp.]|jgi:ATP-binding cassette subfamily B multidrug efflux pump|nr:ABC transporter ATP-binding protein/permease [Lachnospiraceae bacterium]MDY6221929.1 ABC transporter ATP-binding protein [Candidatus Alectryocaccobium sp.]